MIYIAFWILTGYFGGRIAAKKGYWPYLGVLIGILFGPAALVVALFLPRTAEGVYQDEFEADLKEEGRVYDRRKSCPKCTRELSLKTMICPNCEHRFS